MITNINENIPFPIQKNYTKHTSISMDQMQARYRKLI